MGHLVELLQDADGLPPPRRLTEGLDEEAGGPRVQRGEAPPHDVVGVEHLVVVAAAHAQREVAQQQLVGQRPRFHGDERQQGPEAGRGVARCLGSAKEQRRR